MLTQSSNVVSINQIPSKYTQMAKDIILESLRSYIMSFPEQFITINEPESFIWRVYACIQKEDIINDFSYSDPIGGIIQKHYRAMMIDIRNILKDENYSEARRWYIIDHILKSKYGDSNTLAKSLDDLYKDDMWPLMTQTLEELSNLLSTEE